MKTAEQYLDAQLRGPERPQFLTYAEALAAVQAALNDAGTVGQQVGRALDAFFGNPPLLPRTTLVLPGPTSGCARCHKPICVCAYVSRVGEEPPF